MFRNFEQILAAAVKKEKVTIAVAAAADIDVLEAVNQARQQEIADVMLVGEQSSILKICDQNGIDSSFFEIENIKDPRQAAKRAAA